MQWLSRSSSVRPAMGDNDRAAIIIGKRRDRLKTTLKNMRKHDK